MTEFITRNYGQKEFEVIIKTNRKEHYNAAEDFARKLIGHAKQQTNADRIRAMSDEELAEFIVRKVKDIHHQGMYEVALPALFKWLKKPSE